MNNNELRELVHLLLMCGIMDKTATESGNVTNEEWLRMKNLINKYQTEGGINCEPDKSGDLISREALREKLQARYDNGNEDFDKGYNIGIEAAIDLIDNAPTVEPHYVSDLPDDVVKTLQTLAIDYSDGIATFERKRPQGEWIDYDNTFYKCPECGYLLNKDCPHCGNKVILPEGGAE